MAATETTPRTLTEDEILRACATLALSFDEDPLFRFLLPVASVRRAWLELIMAGALHATLPDDAVFVPSAGPGSAVVALVPPHHYPPPFGRNFGLLVRRFPRPDIPMPTVRLLISGIGALRAIDRAHVKEPHYYVQVVGVHPDHKGQGLGRLMVEQATGRADRDHVATYLETSNPINLGFYRRFGFEVREEIATPGGGPPIWTMRRPAKELAA